jgi:hypothetical protein
MKAQSISINTIIIAALALIVLIILIAIMGRNFVVFTNTTSDCRSLGGNCDHTEKECTSLGNVINHGVKCGGNKICCIPLIPE